MKAVVIHAAHDLRIEDRPVEPVEADEIRVRVKTGGICGSDLHYYSHGGFGAVRLCEPMILGHEIAGFVEETGAAVHHLAPGDPVAINPALPCGMCRYCREGLRNQCLDMRFFGSAMRRPHVQGGFCELLVCKARQAVRLADGVDFARAAFAEPLAVCLHAVTRAGTLSGRRVLVSGAGPIGLLTMLAARHAGAGEIVVLDLLDEPLAIAAAHGADRVCNVAADPGGLDTYRADKGYFDVGFEASGSAAGLTTAIDVIRPRGTIVQIGLGGSVELSMVPLVSKEIALTGSFRFDGEFAQAVALIAEGAIDVRLLLTRTFPLADADAAFLLAGDRRRAMKVQLAF